MNKIKDVDHFYHNKALIRSNNFKKTHPETNFNLVNA